MKNFFVGFLVFILSGCSLTPLQNQSWGDFEPYVFGYSPEVSVGFSLNFEASVFFSESILPETLKPESVFVIQKSDFLEWQSDWKDLSDEVLNQDIQSLSLTYEWLPDENALKVTGLIPDLFSENLVLVVTPLVLSEKRVPVNQTKSDREEAYFYIEYPLIQASLDIAAPEVSSSSSNPDNQGLSEATDEAKPAFILDRLVISEVVTDPLWDFSDSLETDDSGVAFDAFAGNGTVSDTDEYIEVYNGSSESINLEGYSLEMLDGTDAIQWLSLEEADDFYWSMNSSLNDFRSEGFLVMGNPTGSLNNNIEINLFNESGELVDHVWIEDANAQDEDSMSYTLDFTTGDWFMQEATPGY